MKVQEHLNDPVAVAFTQAGFKSSQIIYDSVHIEEHEIVFSGYIILSEPFEIKAPFTARFPR